MKQFLVTYHAPISTTDQMAEATPEQIKEGVKVWMGWKAENEENVVNFGARVLQGEERGMNSDWEASKSEVTGFSILQANSLEEIKEKLKSHPQFAWNPACRMSIYECQTV